MRYMQHLCIDQNSPYQQLIGVRSVGTAIFFELGGDHTRSDERKSDWGVASGRPRLFEASHRDSFHGKAAGGSRRR